MKVAYYAEAAGGRPRPADGVRAPSEGRLRARALRAAPRATGVGAVDRRRCSRWSAPASPSGARCCAGRCVPLLGDATPTTCSTAAGIAPTARAEALGLEEWAALARSACCDGAPRDGSRRVRATAYPKLTLSLRVLGRPPRRLPRPRGAGRSRSGNPTTWSRRTRCPRPVACSSRSVGSRSARTCRPTHRNLASIAAEKLLRAAPAGPGHGRAPRAAQAHPRRWRARRRLGRRRRHLVAVRELLDVDIDDAGVMRARGRARFRRAVLRAAAARRGCGAGARSSNRVAVAARAGVRRRRPAVPPVDAGRLPGVGRARRPHSARASCPRRGGWSHGPPRAGQRPRARRRGTSSRASVSSGRRSRAATGAPALLAGSGSAYVVPVDGRATTAAVRRRRGRASSCGSTACARPGCAARECEARRAERPRAEAPTCPAGDAASGCFFRSFLCFFFRMRLRRFLIREPMADAHGSRHTESDAVPSGTVVDVGRGWCNGSTGSFGVPSRGSKPRPRATSTPATEPEDDADGASA